MPQIWNANKTRRSISIVSNGIDSILPDLPMRSPAVHKFMRKHFMPFLYEHGLVRPMASAVGFACTNHAGFHIRMGYELVVGFYDLTGNNLRLCGTITTSGRLKRSLQASIVQPDDLLPKALRADLRALGIQQLSEILNVAPGQRREVPAYLHDAIRKAERDHLSVPDFRYRNDRNLERWCNVVRPAIGDCLAALKAEAEQLHGDTKI